MLPVTIKGAGAARARRAGGLGPSAGAGAGGLGSGGRSGERSSSSPLGFAGLRRGSGAGSGAGLARAYAVFAASQCVRAWGLLQAVELLTHLPVVVFGFLTTLFAAAASCAVQRPWQGQTARRLSRQLWMRVAINGCFYACVWLLWAKGLQESGALRTIILEHSYVCFPGLLAIVSRPKQGLRRKELRAEMLVLAGFCLLLYHHIADEDSASLSAAGAGAGLAARAGGGGGEGESEGDIEAEEVLEELGLVAGLCLLVISSLLNAVRQKFSSKVAKDVGGAKRLQALSLVCAAAVLAPLVLADFVGEAMIGADYDYSVLSGSTLAGCLAVGVCVCVVHFYADSVAQRYVAGKTASVISLAVSFLCALLLVWSHQSQSHQRQAAQGGAAGAGAGALDVLVVAAGEAEVPGPPFAAGAGGAAGDGFGGGVGVGDGVGVGVGMGGHPLMDEERFYAPLVAAWLLSLAGLVDLMRHEDNGFSAAAYGASDASLFGLLWQRISVLVLGEEGVAKDAFAPFFFSGQRGDGGGGGGGGGGDAAAESGACSLPGLRRLLRHVLSSSDSRKIALFLLLNMVFMFVEIAVGWWTNSLGLISDAGHMLFDNMALLIGLFASFAAKWAPDRDFMFGYQRLETLCGFVNGVFLVFVAVFIMTESLERISEPPELQTSGLLGTSVLGFIVNMVGLVFFHEHHGHSHSDAGDCDGGAGAGAGAGGGGGGGAHGHSHGGGGGNDNMHGVFLHILADTLGSLGVIVSTLLIEYKGWYVADPICSLVISVLILLSVRPLLQSTARALLLQVPAADAERFAAALGEVAAMPDVLGVRDPQLWMQTAQHAVVALHVVVMDDTAEQRVLRDVVDLLRRRVRAARQVTVQVYRRQVFLAMLHAHAHAHAHGRKQLAVPLFWDAEARCLRYRHGTDGILALDAKERQQEALRLRGPRAGEMPHGIGGTGAHAASHEHHGHGHGQGQGQGHGHSHGDGEGECHGHHEAHGHHGQGHENEHHGHSHSHSPSHSHGHGHSHGHTNVNTHAGHMDIRVEDADEAEGPSPVL